MLAPCRRLRPASSTTSCHLCSSALTDWQACLALLPHLLSQTAAANEQHYELPTEYFLAALGPHRKYSSCLYDKVGQCEDPCAGCCAGWLCMVANLGVWR